MKYIFANAFSFGVGVAEEWQLTKHLGEGYFDYKPPLA